MLKRFGVGQDTRGEWPAALCIVATVVNLPQVERVFGAMFATNMRHVLRERARELCWHYPGAAAMSGEHMLFVFDIPQERQDAPLLDLVLSSLADRPVRLGSAFAFPVIEANVARFEDAPFDINSVNPIHARGVQPDDDWQNQFVADTRVAEYVFKAMDDGQLDFDFERVCDANEPAVTLYHEALLCKTGDAAGDRLRIGSEVRALERLGVVRRLDRWVVDSVIRRLTVDPGARLGCNISARSAAIDVHWALLIATLAEDPEVASRLTIEITETFPLANLDATREFVSTLRSLGCRIALDDVGHDFGSLRNLISLGVDIVKLDRALVAECCFDAAEAARLSQLVDLAKVCATSVVVEGIETQDDASIARACGATGLQGYLYSSLNNGTANR
ncbi:EAL domain-containing protein [Paraburkholderia hospita]|uniref:EAL domain-containing protein n=1 Tax=Paraburkholderia hospita TaxID=169430 RepID=UPI0013FD363A|nr:EAL domain-containing protein [Paraburkholderia hospita]